MSVLVMVALICTLTETVFCNLFSAGHYKYAYIVLTKYVKSILSTVCSYKDAKAFGASHLLLYSYLMMAYFAPYQAEEAQDTD